MFDVSTLDSLSRKELQALAKETKAIRANAKSADVIAALKEFANSNEATVVEPELAQSQIREVMPEKEWEWDAVSELVEDEVFELSGPNNSIATKIDQGDDDKNCMMVGRVMGANTGEHTISVKLAESSEGGYIWYGVVRDKAPCDEDHTHRESSVGWFIFNDDGGLCGNGKFSDDPAGEIESGQVLTMQADTDAGTLKFWVDGKPHGPGYTSGVTGPLRWATTVMYESNSVEIVPTPELQ